MHDSRFRRIFRIEYLIRPEMAQYNFVPYGDTLMWCDSEKLGDACFLSQDYFNSYTAVYYPGLSSQIEDLKNKSHTSMILEGPKIPFL